MQKIKQWSNNFHIKIQKAIRTTPTGKYPKLQVKYMRLLLQKILMCSRRISQATPPGGCLKAQLTCLLPTTKLLLQKCWCSRRLSQAIPPVGCLKAQLTCYYEALTTKMLVLKKTFSSYTSSRMPEGTVNIF